MKSKKKLKLIIITLVLVFIFGIYAFSIVNLSRDILLEQDSNPNFINTMQPDDNYEENDYYYEAYNLSLYMGISLYYIDGPGIQADDDWYEIYIYPGYNHLLVWLGFSHSEGNIDIDVYDSSLQLITGNNSETDDEYIDVVLPSSGTYYLLIYLEDAGNEYDLWWYADTVDDNYEENDYIAYGYDISLYENTWLSAIYGQGIQFDDDWYEIFIDPGYQHLIVDLTFSHSAGDLNLAVHDDTGSLIISSTSSTDNEKIDYLLPSGGTYYIKVYGDNSGNIYDLKWDENPRGIPGYDLSILFGILLIISIISMIKILKKKPILHKKL